MAFNNHNNNTNLHTFSSTHRGPSNRRSFLDVVLVNQPNPSTRTDRRGLSTSPVRTVDSPMNSRAEDSFDPVSPMTSYASWTPRHDPSLHWRSNQPTTGPSLLDDRWNNYDPPYPVSPATSYVAPTTRRDRSLHWQSQQPTTTQSIQRYPPAAMSWGRPVTNTVRSGIINEELNTKTHTDSWGLGTRPGHDTVGSPRYLLREARFDPMSPATSYAPSTPRHDYTPYLQSPQLNVSSSPSDNRWDDYEFADPMSPAISAASSTPEHDYSPSWNSHEPTTNQSTQQYPSTTQNQDRCFANTVAGTREPVHAPINYLVDANGLSTTTADKNARSPHPPRSSPSSRTRPKPRKRYLPYEQHVPRFEEDKGPRPATPVPPHTAHPTQQTTNDSGERSETTAGAENNQKVTEKGRGTRRGIRRVPVKPGEWQCKMSDGARELRAWAERWGNLQSLPPTVEALKMALEAISKTREPIYPDNRLFFRDFKRAMEGNSHDKARGNKDLTRSLYEKLSRYYPLPGGLAAWTRVELLPQVVNEIRKLQ